MTSRLPRDIPSLTRLLADLERAIGDLRAQQVVVINELDKAQAHLSDASRTLTEFVQVHADVDHATARDLVATGTTLPHHRAIQRRLAAGSITFDRAIVTAAYIRSGATDAEVEASYVLNIHDVRRLTTARRHLRREDERRIHEGRYFTAQPTLDRSRYRVWGELPGYEGAVVEKAIVERADEFQHLSPDVPSTRSQRQADALVAMAQDSLDGRDDGGANANARADVTVFVDARESDASETGAEVAFGPRVGPDTLEALLCHGSVRVVGMDGARPVSTSAARRAIPPAIRDAVAHRDGRCTIDGCRSRYRLQPHHIRPWAEGGSHDVDNLTTLCWYHHHVAVHRSGFTIDPTSPPQRRRLVRQDWAAPILARAGPP